MPGLPIGGQEQQQRLLEHCIASCRATILPLCMSMISWRFSCAPDGMPVCDVSMWSWVATELAQTATQFKYIKWIGWNFHLDGLPRAFLPPDKQEVLLAALAPLSRPGTWLRRTDLRRLIGRLCWFTGARWLKPFMCSWLRCFMKPQMVLQSLDAGQRVELHRCLDTALVVREQCSLSDVQRGWILMEVGAQKVSSADALLCVVSKNVASP